MRKKILHLNVKAEYFNAVKNGEKTEEYRLVNPYWNKRLVGKEYTEIHYKLGYPKSDDGDKIIVFPYHGYVLKKITHKHFGDNEVSVFAIELKET